MNTNYIIKCESGEIYESYNYCDLIIDYISDWIEHIKKVDTIDFDEDRHDLIKGLKDIEKKVFKAITTDEKIKIFNELKTFLKSEYDNNIEFFSLNIEIY